MKNRKRAVDTVTQTTERIEWYNNGNSIGTVFLTFIFYFIWKYLHGYTHIYTAD